MRVRVALTKRRGAIRVASLACWFVAFFIVPRPPIFSQGLPQNTNRAAEQVWLELGSEFAGADPAARLEILDSIDREGELLDEQSDLVLIAFRPDPDPHYHSLSPTRATQSLDYLRALQVSYGRFKGAQAAGDDEWSAKQLKAAQKYAALAADALIDEAQHSEGEAARWRASPFAMRRSAEQQEIFFQKLKADGLTPEQRKLLLAAGASGADIDEFQKQLPEGPRDRIGLSAVEWFSRIAAVRRDLAQQLNDFAQGSPGAVAGTSAQTLEVANPHDKEETIDLFIRPVSIPPDWKLSVTNAEDQPKYGVREVEAGKHYVVTLPAKAKVKVASVVVPVGEVGTNTTARWAVEGKIGNELIGGMVHEMNVPYIIADLKLPPVGSKEVEEELSVPPKPWVRIVAEAAVGIIILGLLAYFFIFWRKRRTGDAPPAS